MTNPPDKTPDTPPENEPEASAPGADPSSPPPAESESPSGEQATTASETAEDKQPPSAPAPPSPANPPRHQRADFSSMIWVALWSACLALGVATGSSVWDRIESRSASRSLLLLPSSETSESDRQQWLAGLLEKDTVASGEWLSPKSLVQRVSTSVPPDLWAQLFSEDDAWLPWLLQLQPADPIADTPALDQALESFRSDPRFRLVLYDRDALARDAELYRNVRTGTFLYAGCMLGLGLLALLLSPSISKFPVEAPLGGMLAVLLAGVAGFVLQQFGAPLERNQWMRSLATAFGLAALFGPMLKGRVTQYFRRRGG